MAGNVCEELYKNKFDVNNLKNDIPTTDKQFYQYLCDISGLNENDNYKVIAGYLKSVEYLIHPYAKSLHENIEFSDVELYEFQKEIKSTFGKAGI